jgi:hypothetical protein
MNKICSWKHHGKEPLDMGKVGDQPGTTHGMCDLCLRTEISTQKKRMTEVNKQGSTYVWKSYEGSK